MEEHTGYFCVYCGLPSPAIPARPSSLSHSEGKGRGALDGEGLKAKCGMLPEVPDALRGFAHMAHVVLKT